MQTGVALLPFSDNAIPPRVRRTTRAAPFIGRAMLLSRYEREPIGDRTLRPSSQLKHPNRFFAVMGVTACSDLAPVPRAGITIMLKSLVTNHAVTQLGPSCAFLSVCSPLDSQARVVSPGVLPATSELTARKVRLRSDDSKQRCAPFVPNQAFLRPVGIRHKASRVARHQSRPPERLVDHCQMCAQSLTSTSGAGWNSNVGKRVCLALRGGA